MKKLLIFAFAVFAFAACTQNDVDELSANRADVPETLTVGFEGADDDTRIQLNEAQKTVWTKDDIVSVFYRSNANQKWQYQGETGERVGVLKRLESGVATRDLDNVVVVYPYNENYYINPNSCNVQAMLPATQHYKQNSYGYDGNIMVSCEEYNQISLRNVCGWLKIQLTGNGERVQSITLRGNNGEQVAGEVYINAYNATSVLASDMGSLPEDDEIGAGGAGGGLQFDDTIFTELTLNCGNGVELGAEATSFYIGVLPQTFEQGISIDVKCKGYKPMTISTDKTLTIDRNHIKPMEVVEFEAEEGNYDDDDDSSSSLPEDINPSSTVFPHRLLLIDHAGASCGNCPRVFDGLDALRQTEVAQYYNEVFVHGGTYAPSSSDKAYSDAAKVVDQYYHPEGYPNIRFNFYDGEGDIGNVASFVNNNTSYINALINPDGAQAGIAAVVTGNSSAVYVSIGVKAAVEQEYRVTAWLLENNIYNPSQSGAYKDSHRIHNHALRNIAGSYSRNDISGDSIGVVAVGEIKECTFELPIISTKWNVSNMEVLIIVSAADASGRFEVVNTALCPIYNSIDYYGNITSSYLETPQPSIVAQNESSFTVEWNAIANASHYTVEFDGRKYETTETKMEFTNLTNLVASKYQVSVTANAAPGSDYCDSVPGLTMVKLTQTSAEIWYKATAKVDFSYTAFGVNVISDVWHNATGEGFITFDGDVTTIGDFAFEYCDSLTSVTIPDSVTTIGDNAFYDCYSLTSVTIGDSVTTIGGCAFDSCSSLTSITIPDSVTTIGYAAFQYCYSLTSVTIGNSVTTIGGWAFSDCYSLTSVTIGDSVTTIGGSAFQYCSSLTSITIPDSVTTIGDSAFLCCSSLTSVTIGDSVTTIGIFAFYDCDSLTEFNGKFASEDGRCLIVNGTLNSFAPVGLTSYTIPDSVTTIGYAAFGECDSLTSVTIPDSVTTIGDYAFYYCRSLTSVTIGDSVTTIGDYAFADCDSLTSVTIPDSVTTIGLQAFIECDSLTSVTIGDNVTTIGGAAFRGCDSLTSVYCEATTPPSLGGNVFYNNAYERLIYVPAESVEAYKTAYNWSEYADYIVGYDFGNGEVVE